MFRIQPTSEYPGGEVMKGLATFFILWLTVYVVGIIVGVTILWFVIRFFSDNVGLIVFSFIAFIAFLFLWISVVVQLVNRWLDRWW